MSNSKSHALALASCFCWATMAPVSKLLFRGLSNMAVLGYGSLIGTAALLAFLAARGKLDVLAQLGPRRLLQLVALGALGYFLYSALYYRGISLLPAQTASILNYLWPLATVLFSIPLLHERVTAPKVAALLLSFAGVVAIVALGDAGAQGGSSILGYACCICGAACYGLFNVLNKRIGGDQNANMVVYIGIGSALALACHVAEGPVLPTPAQWLGLAWIGVFADAVAYLCWALALSGADTARVSNIAFLTPVLSVALCALVLGEEVGLSSALGLTLILGGILLQTFFSERRAKGERPSDGR